jgi:hypothetical protein
VFIAMGRFGVSIFGFEHGALFGAASALRSWFFIPHTQGVHMLVHRGYASTGFAGQVAFSGVFD